MASRDYTLNLEHKSKLNSAWFELFVKFYKISMTKLSPIRGNVMA